MQCKKCGSFLNEGTTFCPNCGSLVEQGETANQNNLNGGVNQAPDLMAGMSTNPETMASNVQPQNVNNAPDLMAAANPQPETMTSNVQPQNVNNAPDLMASSTNPETMASNVQPQNVNNAPDLMAAGAQPQMASFQNLNNGNNAQFTTTVTPSPHKKSNKKVFIIGGIVAVILVVAIACFFIFKNSGTVTNMEGVNVWLPNDFTEESKYGYDKIYASKEKDVIVGLITENAYSVTLDQYMDAIDSGKMMGSVKCEKSTKQTIKGQEWGRVTCSTSTQESNMYITVKDNKLYMVEIAAQSDSANKIASIDNKIKQNLEIVK